jgi:hypothetical protein
MTISIIGDVNLSKLLMIPRFRVILNLDYTFLPASTTTALHQYRLLLPPGTKYVVIGCLAEVLGNQPSTPDVGLSKSKGKIRFSIKCLYLNLSTFLEGTMMDFTQTVTDILDANQGLKAIIIRPLPRRSSGPFGEGLEALQVDFLSNKQ